MLALRAGGRTVPPATVRRVLSHQARSGGWSWSERGSPDSNDTAAAIQALRAAGVGGTPIARGLAYIRRLQNADGGFELTAGRGSDAQSTAWAIQAFIAAGRKPGAAAYRYLAGLRRSDGSYRYSAKYVTTPVWVTAQVLAAVSRKPFPL
jgi:energy-coupling factor transport system substrate-specific component